MNDSTAKTYKGDQPALLSVTALNKTYGNRKILNDISFAISAGQVKVVVGPSGSGKSTMLRIMALLEAADSGSIVLSGKQLGVDSRGRNLSQRHLAPQRTSLGMVFQRFNLFPHLAAVENVMLAQTTVQKTPRAEARVKSMELLERVGLADHGHKYPSELSGGQQQRVAIARALVMNPSVMLFDEPTSALDPELVGEVLKTMEGLAADGMTMVVVTHEISFARRIADEVAMFDEGYIVEQAAPEDFFGAPQHERTRQFLAHVHA